MKKPDSKRKPRKLLRPKPKLTRKLLHLQRQRLRRKRLLARGKRKKMSLIAGKLKKLRKRAKNKRERRNTRLQRPPKRRRKIARPRKLQLGRTKFLGKPNVKLRKPKRDA